MPAQQPKLKSNPTNTSSSSSSNSNEFPLFNINDKDLPWKSDKHARDTTVAPADSIAKRWFVLLNETNGIHLAAIVSVLLCVYIKWSVSLNGYSGKGVPPMFGDFEAQRHWLELTVNLPTSMWYRYDLQYWGLDYPPLTAYHSWILGKIAQLIDPAWVELDKSRGFESYDLQVFMRYTALFTDLIIYTSAVLYFSKSYVTRKDAIGRHTLILAILIQPALALIDHGHFQYNSAMLGFALWAVVFMLNDQHLLGAVMFVFSLCFKQMALYYSLPFFFFLLGKCFQKGFSLFVQLGVTVIATFAGCFYPFIWKLQDIQQVFIRMFPVERGLYEDKVANVWCASSVFIKLRNMFEVQQLVYLSVACTLASVLPACFQVLMRPSKKGLLYTLLNGSLGFFLFSFQVHEKSILLPLMPATLLLLDDHAAGMFFNNVAMFSMYPLLKKDKLIVPTIVVVSLFNLIMGSSLRKVHLFIRLPIFAIYASMVSLIVAEFFIKPPARYPDIYVVLNVLVSTGSFLAVLGWYYYRQFTLEKGGEKETMKKKVQ
ncbi:Glucosyltransferase-like protein [Chytridiales sp. JEL 0842]|nr:Glucosyltransferase-like protein [Chytridiales sp. JEL 0842]